MFNFYYKYFMIDLNSLLAPLSNNKQVDIDLREIANINLEPLR